MNEERLIVDVKSILPHREPFLFISRVISIEPGVRAVAEYDVPENLDVFRGHFPEEPILPGVLVIEMMAQTGALAVLSCEQYRGKIAYLAAIESARFRRPIRPGDTMRAEAVLGPIKRRVGRAQGMVYVGSDLAASGTISFAVSN